MFLKGASRGERTFSLSWEGGDGKGTTIEREEGRDFQIG